MRSPLPNPKRKKSSASKTSYSKGLKLLSIPFFCSIVADFVLNGNFGAVALTTNFYFDDNPQRLSEDDLFKGETFVFVAI